MSVSVHQRPVILSPLHLSALGDVTARKIETLSLTDGSSLLGRVVRDGQGRID